MASAELFSKQEELGLRSEELILFSDSYTIDRTETPARAVRLLLGKHPRCPTYSGRSSLAPPQLPRHLTASTLPTGRKLATLSAGKGRNGQMPTFDVSDSEIEARLQTSWQNDRAKKRARKIEREELRARGLLGRDVKPDDLRLKYQAGMTLDDVKIELKSFLLSSDQS